MKRILTLLAVVAMAVSLNLGCEKKETPPPAPTAPESSTMDKAADDAKNTMDKAAEEGKETVDEAQKEAEK